MDLWMLETTQEPLCEERVQNYTQVVYNEINKHKLPSKMGHDDRHYLYVFMSLWVFLKDVNQCNIGVCTFCC
ncbi:MAG: hypothetical protein WCO51_06125 [bacterium]